jgi:hypothetical protein
MLTASHGDTETQRLRRTATDRSVTEARSAFGGPRSESIANVNRRDAFSGLRLRPTSIVRRFAAPAESRVRALCVSVSRWLFFFVSFVSSVSFV